MQLSEEQAKELKTMARKNFVRIWITAIFVTVALVYVEAIVGKWIIGLISVKITLREAIIIALITNFLLGIIKGLSIYGNSKKNKKEY